MNFQDRVVLITGASNGIGQRLAIDLAARGAIVVGCGRSSERLQATSAEMQRSSPLSSAIQCDVAKLDQVRAMVTGVLAKFGKIDILINNAGVGMRQPFAETPIDVIEAIMRTNYFGMIYCTHEVLPSMIARGSGHIVNISSVSGKIGMLNMAAYCGSKFTMNCLSESLYHELKPLGIDVSVICPGPVRTDFARDFRDREPKAPANLVVTTEAVCKEIIRAIEKKKFEIVLPRWMAFLCALQRLAPGVFRALSYQALHRHIAIASKDQ